MPVAAMQTFRMACGSSGVEWVVDDAALAADLADRWRGYAANPPSSLTIRVTTVSQPLSDAPAAMRPITMDHSTDGTLLRLHFGNTVRVAYDAAAQRMDCALDWPLPAADAGALLDGITGRLLALWWPPSEGLLIHAAGIVTAGGADLFVGPSGVGKTTLAHSVSAERVLHDDALILTRRDGVCAVAPAPWKATSWRAQAGQAQPVGRVFLLDRTGATGVTPLPSAAALASLMRDGCYNAADGPGRCAQVFDAFGALVEQSPCYRLRYRLSVDDPWQLMAATVSRRARTGTAVAAYAGG